MACPTPNDGAPSPGAVPDTEVVWSMSRTVCTGALVGLFLGPLVGYAFESELRSALAPWLDPVQSVIFARAPVPIVVVPTFPPVTASVSPVTVTRTAEAAPLSPRTVTQVRSAAPAPKQLGGAPVRGATVTVTLTPSAVPTPRAPSSSATASSSATTSASRPESSTSAPESSALPSEAVTSVREVTLG